MALHRGAGWPDQPRNAQEGRWLQTEGGEGPDQPTNVRSATAP